MEIAFFGGSFNPPHRGHAGVLSYLDSLTSAAGKKRFDAIWIVPTHQHAFGKELLAFATRYRLCLLLLEDLELSPPRFRILDVEQKIPGANRTIDTLEELQRLHPEARFTLVLGSDLRQELPRWKGYKGIQDLAKILFIPRAGFSLADSESGKEILPFAPDISSTDVRRALAQNHSIKNLLTPKVAQYLLERPQLLKRIESNGQG